MRFLSTAANIGNAFKNAGRVREIFGVFVTTGFADLLHRMKVSRFLPPKVAAKETYADMPVARRLRIAFEELGPTFVKLGQLMASRPDLIPADFVAELEKLQDNVTPVSFADVRLQVESELKQKLEDVFADFNPVPMAAASIGQVHAATLRTGEKVAVKVQRPGIERLIQGDVSILRGVAVLLEKYIPEARPFNPAGLVAEFFKTILHELDYRVEANNTRRIRMNLSDVPDVAVPKVYQEWSTERVLVLEFFEGLRFTDRKQLQAAGLDPLKLVETGGSAFFHMVMRDGLFHADLHAGNLFVFPNGTIGFIDFGIVGRLSRRVQDSIITMFMAIVDEDYETLASEYLILCTSAGDTDLGRLQKDLMDTISPYVGMALGDVNIGHVLLQSTTIAVRHRLQVPRELMLLFKAIFNIESLGKQLEPNFDMLQIGQRLAREALTIRYNRERVSRDLVRIARDVQNLVEPLPRLLRRFMRQWVQNGFALEVQQPDTAALARVVQNLARTLVFITLMVGCIALGITFLILDFYPKLLGLPVASLFSFGLALVLANYTIRGTKRTP